VTHAETGGPPRPVPAPGGSRRPVPAPEGLNADWYGYCHRRELRFQRCSACRAWRHPPRLLCPTCSSGDWTWEASTGRGTVWSWTVTHQVYRPWWADAVPYAVLVVELDEGVRVVAGLRDLEPSALALGLPVEVDFEPAGESLSLPVFRPRR
jgi:uncharacterized OB-fold protein